VAGMRGAGATPRGDGVVTITDAFTYARDRTVRDSAVVAEQPQHPSFSMNLRGRADLPLARVDSSPTALELRETEGPLQLIDLASGLVVLEVPSGKRTLRLAVPLGRYLLRRQGERGTYAREMQVEPGATAVVTEEDLFMAPSMAGTDKGFDSTPPRASFLAPRRYDGLTAYGGPLFAFLAGHTTTRNPHPDESFPRVVDASVWARSSPTRWRARCTRLAQASCSQPSPRPACCSQPTSRSRAPSTCVSKRISSARDISISMRTPASACAATIHPAAAHSAAAACTDYRASRNAATTNGGWVPASKRTSRTTRTSSSSPISA